MVFVVIVIAVAVSVGISVYRAKKIEQERREEKRKQQERYAPKAGAAPAATPAPTAKKPTDPFPSYRADPFGAKEDIPLCLTAEAYGEWLRAFAQAERSGEARIRSSEKQPPFARYLHVSGFSYRSLHKLRGFAPQNRLACQKPAPKQNPAVPVSLLRNEECVRVPLEQKTPHGAMRAERCLIATALPPKSEAHAAYHGYFDL